MLLSLTASVTVIGACALLSRRFSATTVKGFVRVAYLIVLAVVALGYRFLPRHTQTVIAEHMTTTALTRFAFNAATVLAFAGLMLMLLAARSRRSKPPLDPERSQAF